MAESIEDLEKRHSLLHAIKQLEDEVGKESIEDLETRYSLVHAIKETLVRVSLWRSRAAACRMSGSPARAKRSATSSLFGCLAATARSPW
jgi:hypothetical protein